MGLLSRAVKENDGGCVLPLQGALIDRDGRNVDLHRWNDVKGRTPAEVRALFLNSAAILRQIIAKAAESQTEKPEV